MIIETVKFAKEFSVLGSGEWITIGGTLEAGEDPIEAIKEIKQKMISMYEMKSFREDPAYIEQAKNFPLTPVINRAYERMEVLIGNCETLEQLSEHKEFVNKNPDLMTAYSNKLKELTKNIGAI